MTIDPAHCITCGDTAVTATVVSVDGATALVVVDGAEEQVAIELVEPVAAGELLLCHAGVALEKISPAP